MEYLKYLTRELWMRTARLIYWRRSEARFIVILGGPGAGKGTIASRLMEKMGIPHLNMGNLLRAEIENKTEIGLKWAEAVKAGQFIPDKVIMRLLKKEISKPEYRHGAILDGIPRTLSQAKELRNMLMWWGNKVNRVVLLDIEENDVMTRLTGRRTCKNKGCGRSYHLTFTPPQKPDTCDSCGSALDIRDDDRPEVIKERIRVFKETFAPLADFYEKSGYLTRVATNNTRSVDDVLKDVIFTIEQFD